MIIKDDSMSPSYNPDDIIRFATRETPDDGDDVIAAIDGEDEGVLRRYRDRGNGYFELWAINPSYGTIHSDHAKIVGVVTRHVRMLKRR